ncbi:MAG: UDP-N-acetylglucosamine--N-acetylmuramyl-(pentapeptide) pyrophosphoryl-undecaprenol N-acetylglucosamine transferase, partial [Synechococcus sp. SB0665_bin_28]|nr:UDP-N-acetylglucosamine--N-acetylmuramyl-(pentapeptide) pyrophosphoryl-undecaprenol N-acetylglucosamine transferase [Synechococcus sp. SB0665_bin_28]
PVSWARRWVYEPGQGARGLNCMVRQQVRPWLKAGCRVIHLCGRDDPDMGGLRDPAYVERQFTGEMAGLLQHGDLAVSRAGAGSISELAASGCPAVLVPYPHASDQHQEANAAAVAALGAAVIVHENPDGEPLRRAIRRLLEPRLQGVTPALDPWWPWPRPWNFWPGVMQRQMWRKYWILFTKRNAYERERCIPVLNASL